MRHAEKGGAMTIGMDRECVIGERIECIVLNGRLVAQPCIVLGPSTFEAWGESYQAILGREPAAWEVVHAQRTASRFYLVSTD